MIQRLATERGPLIQRVLLGAVLVALACVSATLLRAEFIGSDNPAGFSVCEEATDEFGAPREECEASDIRFEAQQGSGTRFGFSVAAGHLDGDDRVDLVVGDPQRNRVYVFFGRLSATSSYGLSPLDLERGVIAESSADLVLERDPQVPSQVGSFGFSVSVSRERTAAACPPGGTASALLVGAPGEPGTTPNAPGTVFYLPAGALCGFAGDPPGAQIVDPAAIGQSFQSPDPEQDDEFGYSVTFGRVSAVTGSDEDVIVGARGARDGAGAVTVFPVAGGTVDAADASLVKILGQTGDGLGEVVATGDLDEDFDEEDNPLGGADDLAIGAVGDENGKVVLARGPLSPSGGTWGNGDYRQELDPEIRTILGEQPGDFFGFSLAISAEGHLAAGAVFADNDPPGDDSGGDPRSNVRTGSRINAGKLYLSLPGLLNVVGPDATAADADVVLVARRSGDQLGFAVAFADLDASELDDLIVTARREDGSGLGVDEIDQGTAYVVLDNQFQPSPIDLSLCAANEDCTGVAGIDVMIFGGDRGAGQGDEIGYALAAGNFNGDTADDLFLSSVTRNRVYAVTLEDTDEDRLDEGRNIRDNDDDGDGDADPDDCAPLDPDTSSAGEEIPCNDIDENCNGMADDRPDADSDGFDACGGGETAPDCNDDDPNSFPGADELCDGDDNDCDGSLPQDEIDFDEDGFVECGAWDDTQGNNPEILGGNDCEGFRADVYPGAGFNEVAASACMKDTDGDGFGDETPPDGVTAGTDCDDISPDAAGTFPGAAPQDDPLACMQDVDDDDFGDTTPRAGVAAGSDCDDDDANTRPGAIELCDGNDNACAGTVGEGELDDDGDGFVECAPWGDPQGDDPGILGGGDCCDFCPAVHPGAAPNEAVPTACMKDSDGDDYGDIDPPLPGVTPGTDCDDLEPNTFPGAAPLDGPLNCMKDVDGDDYGDDSAVLPVVAGTDCCDTCPRVFPGANDAPDDGVDQDCSGSDTVTCFVDEDSDGYGTTTSVLSPDGDCDDPGESPFDTDCCDTCPLRFPGAEEIPDDGVDQDCNDSDTVTCFVDSDGDGSGGVPAVTTLADDGSCDAAEHEAPVADDCADDDPNSFPGAPELCDGNDNACSGAVPADETDGDGDTYVTCAGWDDTQGDDPAVGGGGDCDDTSSITHPGAAENEGLSAACMRDHDGDGFGDLAPPAGVTPGTDCDDDSPTASSTFPGAAAEDGPLNCMKDVDDDERGDSFVALPVVAGTDCDDLDPATFLGAPELCDGNDNACAGSLDADETDSDGDGFVVCAGWNDAQGDDPGVSGGGDCDDTDAQTFPGAAPHESFGSACMKDHDHDDFGDLSPPAGVTPGTDCDDDSPAAASTYPGAAMIDGPLNCMRDVDDDEYGDSSTSLPVVPGSDCADLDPAVNPGTPEGPSGDPTCSDTVDNDCDGLTDDDDPVCQGTVLPCPDADNDDFADCVTDPDCDSSGLVCGDCNDGSPLVKPGATEVCDNQDNNCDDVVDEGFDQDGDDFTTCDQPVADCDDSNGAVNPGAVELCNDGLDNDCNAGTPDIFDADEDGAACDVDCDDGDAALNLVDADSDGFSTCSGECDDGNPSINPGAGERCNNGIDDDCNAATPDIFDADSDGWTCEMDCDDDDPGLNLDDADSDSYTTCTGDCNDLVGEINPSAVETCDGTDNNCDGTVDEDFDLDSDGFSICDQPIPDCNDASPLVNPGVPEACGDAVDNDCNPLTPDIFDADSDGSACNLDCADEDPASYPGAAQVCDGNDNPCSGSVPVNETDVDGDGFVECVAWNDTQGDNPAVTGGGDCDESDSRSFPGAAPNETNPTACMKDTDEDDYGDLAPPPGVTAGTDCDDDSPEGAATFPGAAEIDGPLNCMKDSDDDGYGDSAVSLPVVAGTDCDDARPAVNPAAVEGPAGDPTCSDTLDNDCDTLVDVADPDCPQLRSERLRRPARKTTPKRSRLRESGAARGR